MESIFGVILIIYLFLGSKRTRPQIRISDSKETRFYFGDFFLKRPHFSRAFCAPDIIIALLFLEGIYFISLEALYVAIVWFLSATIIFYYSHFYPAPVVEPKGNYSRSNQRANFGEGHEAGGERRGRFSPMGDMVKLYHTLARRYHPDRARTFEDRMRSESVMKAINRAYQEHDEITLRLIASRTESSGPKR